VRSVEDTGGSRDIPDRRGLLARLKGPQPWDTTLLAEADLYMRHNPGDEELKRARERLPELDDSE
jgi:hypothetical protein